MCCSYFSAPVHGTLFFWWRIIFRYFLHLMVFTCKCFVLRYSKYLLNSVSISYCFRTPVECTSWIYKLQQPTSLSSMIFFSLKDTIQTLREKKKNHVQCWTWFSEQTFTHVAIKIIRGSQEIPAGSNSVWRLKANLDLNFSIGLKIEESSFLCTQHSWNIFYQ